LWSRVVQGFDRAWGEHANDELGRDVEEQCRLTVQAQKSGRVWRGKKSGEKKLSKIDVDRRTAHKQSKEKAGVGRRRARFEKRREKTKKYLYHWTLGEQRVYKVLGGVRNRELFPGGNWKRVEGVAECRDDQVQHWESYSKPTLMAPTGRV